MLKIEDYFTPREIFEAMKMIFTDSSDKRKYRGAPSEAQYRGAPSEALRRYYLLDECGYPAVCSGKKYDDVEKHISDMKSQFEDAFGIEDWEYEASNTYNNYYKYACIHRAEDLKAKQQAGEQPTGEV